MSASLVGSEMCIRDRARATGRRQDLRDLLRLGRAHPGQRASTYDGHAWGCLLYTSDAADDM
eukprot:4294555-Alexandrium_andersonii.AAC.1